MQQVQAHWFAILSNRETVEENTGVFVEVAGELSPWLKLIKYCEDNALNMLTVGINVKDETQERAYRLPSLFPNQQWSYSFTDKENHSLLLLPKGFNYFRRVIRDSRPEFPEQHFIEIHAIYDQFTLVTIVNEDTGDESWSVVIANKEGHESI